MVRVLRRLALVLLCVCLVGGLLLAGPGHLVLHADHPDAPCDACGLSGTEGPERLVFPGPEHALVLRMGARAERVPDLELAVTGRPRGPPRA